VTVIVTRKAKQALAESTDLDETEVAGE